MRSLDEDRRADRAADLSATSLTLRPGATRAATPFASLHAARRIRRSFAECPIIGSTTTHRSSAAGLHRRQPPPDASNKDAAIARELPSWPELVRDGGHLSKPARGVGRARGQQPERASESPWRRTEGSRPRAGVSLSRGALEAQGRTFEVAKHSRIREEDIRRRQSRSLLAVHSDQQTYSRRVRLT